MTETQPGRPEWDRRSFLKAGGPGLIGGIVAANIASPAPVAAQEAAAANPREPVALALDINGETHRLSVDVRTTLLDTLREHLALTGSKKGCDHGQCGACTVHVDGKRVLSCLTLAVAAVGHKVTTIEGLSTSPDKLHPMQQAFVDRDALQCGYCTPGQIMSAVGCVSEGHAGSDEEIREYMSGNLCRCAAYPNIVAAVRQARQTMEG